MTLDANEGPEPPAWLLEAGRSLSAGAIWRYPSQEAVRTTLARRHDVATGCVFVGAGADEVLDRLCRAYLEPGREIVHHAPTFEMLARYARLAGATAQVVPWVRGALPVDAMLQALSPVTAMIVVTTPNNPTGAVATAADLRRLSQAAPHALLVVDLAYTEFADVDLTPTVLAIPNAVALRTLSKAWGLAGLRVGYALASDASVVEALRLVGGPFSVTGVSAALAEVRLNGDDADVGEYIRRVREERAALGRVLASSGEMPLPSQGNFVFLESPRAEAIHAALAREGIAVRFRPAGEGLGPSLRITCPGDEGRFAQLLNALRRAVMNASATLARSA